MKSRIAIIGTVGVPAKYGGFETLAEQLLYELHQDFNFTTYCSGLYYKNKTPHPLTKRIFIPINANGKSSVLYDFISIIHALFYADVILLLGVSAAFMIPFVRLFSKTRIITNIDGLEWKRQKWSRFAKNYLKSQEKIAVKYSHKIIADNQAIKDYVLNKYKRESEYIAYGGNHVKKLLKKKKEKYAFSVCRIEPENNVHIILKAFSETNYPLIFVGNWGSSSYGKKLKEKYTVFKNITLSDPIYEQEKLDNLRSNSTIYIHGHSAGGTNPSLVEAMWLGLPVFCWDIVYNKLTTHEKTMFFHNASSLKLLLNTSEKKLNIIANELQSIAFQKYNWQTIANQYKLLLNNGLDLISPIKKVKISASIVIYKNDIEMLQKAIDSFLSVELNKKLFLIDNSPTYVLKDKFTHPEVEYFYLGKNKGYGKANNVIINKIKEQSEYHLILNPDVFFDKSVIPKLIEQHEKHDNIAVISPKTLYPNGEFQHSCRRYPTFFELIFRRLKIFKSITDKGEYKDLDLSKAFNPDFIQGAFLLFKTKDFVNLKGFDERFFMYMEDVDLCKRIDLLEKKKLYFPKVKIYHHYTQGSAKKISLFFYHLLSAIQYFYKWNFIIKNGRDFK